MPQFYDDIQSLFGDGSTSSSSRRVSDSSATTYSGDHRYPTNFDHAKQEARAYAVIYHARQPYAALNELVQAGCILNLECKFTQELEQLWKVELDCVKYGGSAYRATATAGSKAKAKAKASSTLLHDMFPDARSDVSCEPETTTKPFDLTRKQSEERNRDQLAESMLQNMIPHCTIMGSKTVFISLDLEVYELNHNYITEVGLAYMTGATSMMQERAISSVHLIVGDNAQYRNGRYCADERENFRFGASETIAEAELGMRIIDLLTSVTMNAERVYIVGHSVNGDLAWLKRHHIDVGKIVGGQCLVEVCDIARVYRAMQWDGKYQSMCGMSTIMDAFGLDSDGVHNGGNDATFNLQVLCTMINKFIDWDHGCALL